jgi:hypothetical protein
MEVFMLTAKTHGHLRRPRDPGLVLTRRAGETIVIPSGGTIKLHFAAPPDIKILRGELVIADASPEAA